MMLTWKMKSEDNTEDEKAKEDDSDLSVSPRNTSKALVILYLVWTLEQCARFFLIPSDLVF